MLLAGRSVLVVEDEFLIAEEMRSLVQQLGGTVIGPAGSIDAALDLLRVITPDIALLDINLHGNRVYLVAEALGAARVPFIFATGYDARLVDARFQDAPHLAKPFSLSGLRAALRHIPLQ